MDYDMFDGRVRSVPSKKFNISVTQEHIDNGKQGDALLCPTALAIKELIKKDCDVLSTTKQILFYDRKFDRSDIDVVLGKGRINVINLSEEVSRILKDYEITKVMEPFEFEIPIPVMILDESK